MSDPEHAAAEGAPLVDARHPWLGLSPFTAQQSAFFFGRDAEMEEILGRIQENNLTVLFGQSGLGKTSLLGAGVIPRLAGNNFSPVLLRLDHTPNAPPLLVQTRDALREALPETAWPDDFARVSLWESFHRLPLPISEDSPCVPVIIFDQFEEIFTLGRQTSAKEAEAAEWLEQIADLLQNRPPSSLEERFAENRRLAREYEFGRCPLRVVFSLREDYLSHLEEWKIRLPLLTRNRMALRPLSGSQALEAVLGPASLGEEPLMSREVAASIVRTAAKVAPDAPLAEIKAVPPLLSLLCEQLNALRVESNAAVIDADMVRERSGNILQRFYEDSFAAFPEEHREAIRSLVEDPPMVTEGGYRNSLVREDAEATLSRAGVADSASVFDQLIRRRLITQEEHAGLRRLEITHDVLVPLVVGSRKNRRERLAKELALRTLAEESAKARRRQILVGAMSLLTLLAFAGGVYGVRQAKVSRVSEQKAVEMAKIAEQESRKTAEALLEVKKQHRKAEELAVTAARLAETARAAESRAKDNLAVAESETEKARQLQENLETILHEHLPYRFAAALSDNNVERQAEFGRTRWIT